MDGTPPESINGNLKLTVTETIDEPEPWGRPWWRRWRPTPIETTRNQPVQNLSIEPDGVVYFKFRTSDEVKKISVKVKCYIPALNQPLEYLRIRCLNVTGLGKPLHSKPLKYLSC